MIPIEQRKPPAPTTMLYVFAGEDIKNKPKPINDAVPVLMKIDGDFYYHITVLSTKSDHCMSEGWYKTPAIAKENFEKQKEKQIKAEEKEARRANQAGKEPAEKASTIMTPDFMNPKKD